MLHLDHTGLVDLVVLAVAVGAGVSALRHRSGALGVLGAVIGSLALAWVVIVALVTWGPQSVSDAARDSAFVQTFPMPDRALHDLHDLSHETPQARP